MGKKILKIIAGFLLVVILLLVAAPFILEAKIGDLIKNNVNDNVNATLDFSNAELSLISSFPNAELRLQQITLINKVPFEGDTLFAAKDINLTLGFSELFKSAGEPIAVKNLSVDGATVNVQVNEQELASYDIGKNDSDSNSTTSEDSESFILDLQSYEISNSTIIYDDKVARVYLEVLEIQHKGTGDLSATTSELKTNTEALVTFELDSANYLNKNKIKLNALIGIDLAADTYTFLENEAIINQLPLVFDGFVKVNENSQDIDLSFKTPSSDFKNFLAILPEMYSQNIDNVQTSGDFVLQGKFNGRVDEKHIPKFDIKINSNNASFKYPDLPKSVRNVFIDVNLVNSTGIVEDTYVAIDKLSFMIDEDKFNMTAKINELMGNTKVKAHVNGRMNLANIEKAYPVPAGLNLKGMLKADISTVFDMASVEKKQYKNTKTSGNMSLNDFEYNSDEILNPLKLKSTVLTFNPETVTLNELNGSTGETDFNATGTIDNLLGYMLNDEKVQGNFNLNSDTFKLTDFMTSGELQDDEIDSESIEEKIKIPSFLDVTINVAANKVYYDNLILNDVKGNLQIKDEKAILTDMSSSIFNGRMAFNGEVSTKDETPTFAMKLGMDQLQIGETFKSLELFKVLAPIAEVLKGTLDSDIELSGALTDDFTPDLLTLNGDMLANIFTKNVDVDSAPLVATLVSKLDFIELKQLNLSDLKTKLSFKDGLVSVKPFTIKYQDIDIAIYGNHTFDKKMNYKASMEMPVKYLGEEVNSLIRKIGEKELENLTIPVTANIGGDYSNPQVTTDMSSGIKTLTSKLIEIQKQKLINQGKDKALDLLGDVLGSNSSEAEGTTKEKNVTEEAVKNVLGGILGEKNKNDSTATKTDSVPEKTDEEVVKEKAKDILSGFLGRKKKKTEKDSAN